MSTKRREHRAWQDGHHLAQHAWLTLCQRVRAHAVVPDRLPRLWQHPPLGYLVAVLAQLAAVGLTLPLRYLLVQAFPYRGALSFLVVVLVALRWGVGPSLLTTLVGAALLNYAILPPYSAWSLGASQIVATLLFLSIGLSISVLVSRTERARQMAQAATAREHELRAKAEAAVQMRDEILNLATHDMRTAVTPALGHVQLVQYDLSRGRARDDAWLAAQMQAIGGALRRLNAMIDEMSDVARLQVLCSHER
jgi:K+-sensing histidine kinase KdpD